MKEVLVDLRAGFNHTLNGSIALLGLASTWLAWVRKPTDTVPVWLLAATLWLCLWAVIGLSAALIRSARRRLPFASPIRYAEKMKNGEVVLLLDAEAGFFQGMVVTIVLSDHSNMERVMGFGHVSNIQGDGRIQVTVLRVEDSFAKEFGALARRDAELLARTQVRPTVRSTADFPSREVKPNG